MFSDRYWRSLASSNSTTGGTISGCFIAYKGTERARFSFTCGILFDDSDAGYCSCGHQKSVGDEAYYYPPNSSPPYYSTTWPPKSALTKLGPVAQLAVGGDVDYSIIDVQNLDNSPAGVSLNGLSANYQGGWPWQDDAVKFCGIFSQNSGTVIDDDGNANLSGIEFTHVLICTNTCQSGDSGGPLFWEFSPGNLSLSGLLSGYNPIGSVFTRFDNDRSHGGFNMAKW